MVHAKPALPAGHGEIVARPPFEEWAALARANHEAAGAWSFSVAGIPATEYRDGARRQSLGSAATYSARLGVEVAGPGSPDDLIVATGHQPELFHPGVWIKHFLLQRFVDEDPSATAIDFVVDSDGFEVLGVSAPCMAPGLRRCRQYLAIGSQDTWYAKAAVPSERDLDDFCSAADNMLSSLPAPAVRRHFAAFCRDLDAARPLSDNLGDFVTIARRRYEVPAGSDYLELPVTRLVHTEAFRTFVADLALNARRFAEAYNAELAEYRIVNKTRSSAQPFPDLSVADNAVELPLWLLGPRGRSSIVARRADGAVLLEGADGTVIVELPTDEQGAVAALCASDATIAPKALALTSFVRMFGCDLFIHGVGGGRYDRVTDGVCRRYYGVEPPEYVVASITMYLPVGAHMVTEDEVAASRARLNRLEHNPDALLAEVEFDSEQERSRAAQLAAEKSGLVSAIAGPDADKKALGTRIREINIELGGLLAPMRAELEREVETLEAQLADSEILTDRTYPFCFWSPQEIADKAR